MTSEAARDGSARASEHHSQSISALSALAQLWSGPRPLGSWRKASLQRLQSKDPTWFRSEGPQITPISSLWLRVCNLQGLGFRVWGFRPYGLHPRTELCLAAAWLLSSPSHRKCWPWARRPGTCRRRECPLACLFTRNLTSDLTNIRKTNKILLAAFACKKVRPHGFYSSIRLSIYPSINMYIYPSIHLCIHPSIHPSVRLFIYLSTYVPIYLWVISLCAHTYTAPHVHAHRHTHTDMLTYTYVCIVMYLCISLIYIHVYKYAYHIPVHTYMHTFIYIYNIYTHIHVHTYVCLYMRACTHVHMYTCAPTRTYILTYLHACMHAYIKFT